MAFRKIASCLILAAALKAAEFPVLYKKLRGTIRVDDAGVYFAGQKNTTFDWKYQDIQEFKLAPGGITILTYSDNRYLLGADRAYTFAGKIPAEEIYSMLKNRLDQRFVAAFVPQVAADGWSIPVKHLLRISGTEGTLTFSSDAVVYSTAAKDDSRTWRYADIDSISSSGPFQLTITTFERARAHYGDRKSLNFQLREQLPEAKYNELWMEIERKNGRIQQ